MLEFITIEELEKMELVDLYRYLDELNEKIKPHTIEFNEIPMEFKYRTKIEMTDLKDYFHFDHKNRKYVFPQLYDDFRGFSFLGHEPLPAKGFFWKVTVTHNTYQFGLLYMLFELKKVGPSSDLRYLGDRTVFKDEYEMFYDFESDMYVHVSKKNKEDIDQFNHRRHLYSLVLEKLENLNNEYKVNLEKAVKVLGLHTNRNMTEVKRLKALFLEAKKFIKENKQYLRAKVILAQITRQHFLKLLQEMERIERQTDTFIEFLEEFEERNFSSIANRGEFSDALEEKSKLIREFRNSIVQLFVYRDTQSTFFKPKDGFFAFNDERLFENLPQIEIESSLAIISETKNRREQIKKELLITWQKEIEESR